MKFWPLLFALASIFPITLFGQVTGIEQDCINALPICADQFTQAQTYRGEGSNTNEIPPSSCLANQENNSVWYIFTTSTAGVLEFTINPLAGDDYDFAMYNITNLNCSDIFSGVAPEVRCSYAVTNGATGIGNGGTLNSAGPNGPPFLAPLNVGVGETFALMVDNFAGNSTAGYTIDFTNSTTSIKDTIPPVIDSVNTQASCVASNQLTVYFSEPILCSTIATNGSDFQVTGPSGVSIIAANANCGTGRYTNSVVLTLSAPILIGGVYNIQPRVGTDGNSIQDKCQYNAITTPVPFRRDAVITPDFSASFVAACNIDTVNLTNLSTPAANITSVLWDFGDATTSTQVANTFHVYNAVGTYTITLTVNTADCTEQIQRNVTVNRSFEPGFTIDPIDPCPGEPVQFTDTTAASGALYLWRFGDGNIASSPNPVNTYTSPGVYQVYMRVEYPVINCIDSAIASLTVNAPAVARFGLDTNVVCQGSTVTLLDSSAGVPTAWRWDFGNGDTATVQNPTYTFNTVGVFDVALRVSNVCNTDDTTQQIEVRVLPSFSLGNDTSFCKPDSILLTAYLGADSYLWSTGATTESIYFLDVPNDVRVTATVNGCSYEDAIFVDEQIENCLKLNLPTAFTPESGNKNNFFRLVDPQRIDEVTIKIFNRWGRMVYQSNLVNFAWDGTTINGEKAPVGVYAWFIEARGLSGQNTFAKGNVTLIR
ncbi:MAG: PKD domain-containing protein [Chitinophagales bacterium]|nr:PKD domain-containing protein [Chitinophagales bacterium]